MSDPSCYSPGFKKPCDVLRMSRKRARSETSGRKPSSPQLSVDGIRRFSPGPLLTAPRRTSGVKRRNPFASIENTYSSPNKRVSSDPENQNTAADRTADPLTLQEAVSVSGEEGLFEPEKFSPVLKSADGRVVCDDAPPEVCLEFPTDWSLKTRLLFTSPRSLSWADHLRAQEEAEGLSSHCRAAFSRLPADIEDPRGCAELRSAFQQCLLYWQHPSFSWLSLFPRIGAERRFSGKSAPWAQDADLQQSLMSDWSVSLTSLYSLLKARLCPYFYLCSYQLTVLFRAAGLNGSDGISALLSPSTRGLREAMKSEGIEFTLPLLEERKKSRDQSSSEETDTEDPAGGTAVNSEHGEDEDEDDEDADGGFSWLKEMGVQDQIKKPDAISIKLRKEHREVRLDHRPESVLLVQGSDTFTLLNFLINCKSLVAAAGPQAGLPPTLLAPTAFRGATLHTLKARAVNVKTQVRAGYQDLCSLEVVGPIMPHTLHALTQLLRATQKGEFSVGLYTHEPSAVFSVPISQSSEPSPPEVVEDLRRCGLQQSTVQQLATATTLGRSALRQLHMRENSYSWRT